MAPEIQKGQQYESNTDLWSIGILIFELLAGVPPFNARNKAELAEKIEK